MDGKVHVYAAALLATTLLMGAGAFWYGWQRIGTSGWQGAMVLAGASVFAVVLLGAFYLDPAARRGVVFMGTFLLLIVGPNCLTPLWPVSPTSTDPQVKAASSGYRIDVPVTSKRVLSAWMERYPDGSHVLSQQFSDHDTALAQPLRDGRVPAKLGSVVGWSDGYPSHHMFVFVDGAVLHTWYANDEQTLRRRVTAALATAKGRGALDRMRPSPTSALDTVASGWGSMAKPGWIPLSLLAAYGVIVLLFFFRGATWAGTWEAARGVPPVGAAELRESLLALGSDENLPFEVRPGARADEVVVQWRYADATWLSLMRVHRLSYLTRYVIRLSPDEHTVRVREYTSEFDGSAGAGGAQLSFKASYGMTLYEKRQGTVVGFQIKDGRLTRDLSYTYRFDVEEMRGPLRQVVNDAGWDFKQVVVFLPWLTG